MPQPRGLLGLLGLLACAPLLLADWPSFRGNPLQDGVAQSQLPEQLVELWRVTKKDSFESTAAIVGPHVIVGCLDNSVYCFRLADGQEVWAASTGGTNGIKASPAVVAGRVFVGDQDGVFHCLSAETGKKIWSQTTEGEITSSAVVVGDRVLVGSYDEHLYCFQAADGKLLWKVKTDGPINCSPAVVEGRTFVAGCDSTLRIIEVATGKELGQVDLKGQAGASPAIAGDLLFVGNMDRTFLAIDRRQGGGTRGCMNPLDHSRSTPGGLWAPTWSWGAGATAASMPSTARPVWNAGPFKLGSGWKARRSSWVSAFTAAPATGRSMG